MFCRTLDRYKKVKKGPDTMMSITGLVAAVFTPFKDDCSLNFGLVPRVSEHLLQSGVGGLCVCGSTYNFLAPLYNEVIRCHNEKKTEEAEALQAQAVALVRVMLAHRGLPANKMCMKLIGLDCGPARLPLLTLSEEETASLKAHLEPLGFFDWATPK